MPLHIASSNGALECVKVLCDAGFSITAKSKYALVSETLDTGKVRVRVDKAEVAKTAEGWTVLAGHFDVFTYLRARRT
jgi:hypothetical protein